MQASTMKLGGTAVTLVASRAPGPVAGAAVAAATILVVTWDGSAVWQVVRAGVAVAVSLALVTVLRRGALPVRALAGVATGVFGLAVGLGIGVPHLTKAGVHPLTVAGLVAAVAGLGLFVQGVGGLVRAVRSRWRYGVPPTLVILAAVVVFSASQAVAVTNVPPIPLGDRTPADHGLAYRDVTVRAADGVDLASWYVPSRNRAAVVVRHGAGSTRSGVLEQAEVLAGAGYGVLLMDARGHGESGGRAMDFGWYGDLDIEAGVSFLAAEPDVDPERIAVVGMSMGGEEAIGALAADGRIAAVVAEGATNRQAADKVWLVDDYGVRGRAQQTIDRLTYGLTDLLTSASPPTPLRDAVTSSDRPVLLIAAGDVETEGRVARWLQAANPSTVERWVVPGAGHTAGLRVAPDEWERRVIGFLDDALRPASRS